MSANNYLLIRENDSGEYWVEERDADVTSVTEKLGPFLHARDALEAAQKHQEENEVEYGISFAAAPKEKETPPSESTPNPET